jgi:hypothetical protein
MMSMAEMNYLYIPPADKIADWVLALRDARWASFDTMVALHTALHRTFGNEPNDALLEGERELSVGLRSAGLEHRYTDALAKAAGTIIANPAEPTLEEVAYYLKPILVHSCCVDLLQGVEAAGQIFIKIAEDSLPTGAAKSVLKAINRMMPPGITLKPLPKTPREDYIRILHAYDLQMCGSMGGKQVMVEPWTKEMMESAPSSVFKEGKLDIQLKKVLKQEFAAKDGSLPERYVLGPVLIPEEEDAQGEIYSHAEVRKACHWWAEHGQNLSHRHVLQGGTACRDGELTMLENYVLPADCVIEGTSLKAGTWMLAARVNDDALWEKVRAGQIDAWSIGAEVLACTEDVPVTA